MARASTVTSAAARALGSELVDYAGLFPPAGLSMERAIAEYARWQRAPERWLLGRFVVPATRLAELARAAETLLPAAPSGGPWRLAALLGDDLRTDAALVASFNAGHEGRLIADTLELRAGSAAQAELALEALPRGLAVYVEVPLSGQISSLLALLAARDARAKVRTGGLVPEAIPGTGELARFIAACAEARVPFKATAGLHRALRASRALTYAADSPVAPMHGFLNVFAAAAFAWQGASLPQIEGVLAEQDAAGLRLDDSGLAWHGLHATSRDLALCRSSFACAFGSCSFAEPVADLRELGVIG